MALMKAVGREESPGLFGFGEAGAKMDERREKFHRLCGGTRRSHALVTGRRASVH